MDMNMNWVKEKLRRKTWLYYIYTIWRAGCHALRVDRQKRMWVISLACLGLLGVWFACRREHYSFDELRVIAIVGYAILWLAAMTMLIMTVGYVPGSFCMYDDFIRVGWTNSAGEAPVLIGQSSDGRTLSLTFWVKGLPRAGWVENRDRLQSALNLYIVDVIEGADLRTVTLNCVAAETSVPNVVRWVDALLPPDDNILLLGESVMGPVAVDLSVTPHMLIAGITGSGKSKLLELIAYECVQHNMRVTIMDAKGGADYFALRDDVALLVDNTALLTVLDDMVHEMYMRREQLRASGCANIAEYRESGHDMRRHIIIIDETSIVLDATGRNKAEKEEIGTILAGLLTLTRLGRYVGLHVVIATQRPDVASVPGALKANLDARVCGHMPDATSSCVVLDDGSAADLPARPGRFLLRDASGIDKVFQAFLYV